jgi:hypothetical protein
VEREHVSELKRLQGYKVEKGEIANTHIVFVFFNHVTLLTNHVASRGLSVPAIDSRIEVSACTFFIR